MSKSCSFLTSTAVACSSSLFHTCFPVATNTTHISEFTDNDDYYYYYRLLCHKGSIKTIYTQTNIPTKIIKSHQIITDTMFPGRVLNVGASISLFQHFHAEMNDSTILTNEKAEQLYVVIFYHFCFLSQYRPLNLFERQVNWATENLATEFRVWIRDRFGVSVRFRNHYFCGPPDCCPADDRQPACQQRATGHIQPILCYPGGRMCSPKW